MERVLVLENLRSIFNVGSIFRIADSAGVKKIYLIGTTPTPIDRFGRENSKLTKTALGAEKTVEWEYAKNTIDALKKLKGAYKIISMEQTPTAKIYSDFKYNGDIAFIVGNEIDGVEQATLNASDAIVMLNQEGEKESLNVAVATAIILYNSKLF